MKISISRRGFAPKTIMYHGTSSVFLRSILKNGLRANPPKKVWDSGHLESLPGVYTTTVLKTALDASEKAVNIFDGDQIVVVIDGQIRAGLYDEDIITWVSDQEFTDIIDKASKTLDIDTFLGDIEKACTHKIKTYQKLIFDFQERVASKLSMKGIITTRKEAFNELLHNLFCGLVKKEHTGDSSFYLKALNDITKMLRTSQLSGWMSLRFTNDITFSGATKIVAILEKSASKLDGWVLHYGKVPDDFVSHYRKSYNIEPKIESK